jgi:GAF domain-containing protein
VSVIHAHDVLADPEFALLDAQKLDTFRTALGVPLLREGNPIGTLFLSRAAVDPFTQQQIDLVTTFANQAVIAIENVRLFDEVQARTRELSQSVEELRALGEVSLKAVGAPAAVALIDSDASIMSPLAAAGMAIEQQVVDLHHPVNPFVIGRL